MKFKHVPYTLIQDEDKGVYAYQLHGGKILCPGSILAECNMAASCSPLLVNESHDSPASGIAHELHKTGLVGVFVVKISFVKLSEWNI